MSTNATIQCECCSSQLAKPLRLGKTRRDICDDCLGFMARWWIELGIWEMPEQESPTANANPATPSPAPCAAPPSEPISPEQVRDGPSAA